MSRNENGSSAPSALSQTAQPTQQVDRSPGSGSLPGIHHELDRLAYTYSDLMHDSGLTGALDATQPGLRDVDFTPPATSFKLQDAREESSRPYKRWQEMKHLHHDTKFDYTGTNRSAKMARYREDATYYQAIIGLLELPAYLSKNAVFRCIQVDVTAFNFHYEGRLGAALASAVVELSNSPEAFFDTAWEQVLEETLAKLDASFELSDLVEFAFEQWGDTS